MGNSTRYKWLFSIAMFVHQRVTLIDYPWLPHDSPVFRHTNCHNAPDSQEELGSVDQGEPGGKTGAEGAAWSSQPSAVAKVRWLAVEVPVVFFLPNVWRHMNIYSIIYSNYYIYIFIHLQVYIYIYIDICTQLNIYTLHNIVNHSYINIYMCVSVCTYIC